MPDGLYEHDAFAWAERQSDLLRRLAAGERINEAIDWPHVIEEINDVGQSALRACRSFLQQTLVHLLKLRAWPHSPASAHWTDEAYRFADDAQGAFSPSMRQLINLADVYAKALRRVAQLKDASGMPQPLPHVCPLTLDELLKGDVPDLVTKLRA